MWHRLNFLHSELSGCSLNWVENFAKQNVANHLIPRLFNIYLTALRALATTKLAEQNYKQYMNKQLFSTGKAMFHLYS